MKHFMAQVGIHGEPATSASWKGKPIEDDPVKASNGALVEEGPAARDKGPLALVEI